MRSILLLAVLAVPVLGYARIASGGGAGQVVPGAALTIDWRLGATNLKNTVEPGTIVAWRSTDGMPHTVTSRSSPAAFGELALSGNGTAATIRFDVPGSYPYFCSIHGPQLMNGTIVVTAAR